MSCDKSLLSCRVVCKSWYLFFSDPLFLKLHLARSPTYLIPWSLGKPMKFYSRYCRSLEPGMSSEASSATQDNDTLWWESKYTCINSSNGLLCLENSKSSDEIYVCNPILGQYITIKTGNVRFLGFYLGFSSRSNQFKVLQINSPRHIAPYMARIYTIGDHTRQWKSIGIAPSYPYFRFCGLLNGSIHWADEKAREIFYFNFDTEQFGSLPSPPVRGDGRMFAAMGVLDGCLFCYGVEESWTMGSIHQGMQFWNMGFWVMKEYGVEESWTKIFSIDNTETNQVFSSLHKKDVAKGEQLNLIS